MSVQFVSKGQPITAFWANSLVNAINTQSTGKGQSHINTGYNPLHQYVNPAAFQIQMTSSGAFTIEPGTIFINGVEIVGKGTTYSNNKSSLQNWEDVFFHKGKKLPKWKIKGYIPREYTGDVSASKFWLINDNSEAEPNKENMPPEEVPAGCMWWEQVINETDEEQGTVKQIVSGSIYITLPVPASTARPFDVRIASVKEISPEENADGETEGEDGETVQEVEFEVYSGCVQMPNKEMVIVPQRLQLKKTITEPVFVTLKLVRDADGKIKYKHDVLTYAEFAQAGWTLTDAIDHE